MNSTDSDWRPRDVLVQAILLRGIFDPYRLLSFVCVSSSCTSVYNIISNAAFSLTFILRAVLILKNRDWSPRSWVIHKIPISLSHTRIKCIFWAHARLYLCVCVPYCVAEVVVTEGDTKWKWKRNNSYLGIIHTYVVSWPLLGEQTLLLLNSNPVVVLELYIRLVYFCVCCIIHFYRM